MKTRPAATRPTQAGYALLLALVFVAVNLLLLTSLLSWTSGNALVTDRNNAYNGAAEAAEAATEQVLSGMTRDFINQSFNPANLNKYRSLIPTNDWTADYEFSDGDGVVSQTWVSSSPQASTTLNSPFGELYGSNYACTIRSNVKLRSTAYPNLAVGVRQDFQLASIPIFQFAIFYALDLEINPAADMTLTGKVHGNADIYVSPDVPLEFMDGVGAVGNIYYHRSTNDPNWSYGILPTYDSFHEAGVGSLTLPTGTNNSPTSLQRILDAPPYVEDPASALGKQQYYNKADLIVTTTDTNWTVNLKAYGSTTISDSWSGTNSFLTTKSFQDDRENNKTVLSIDIDVGDFYLWMNANSSWHTGEPICIYVDDQRVVSGNELAAVRVTDGQFLQSPLTIATARPLYVQGHFNAPIPGSADTSGTQPASLVGDSITILSNGWLDQESGNPLSSRDAKDTTVNAAILAGIVPSTTDAGGIKHYSGGVENFPRLLEDWSGTTLTINGSMVALFPSRYATNYWVSSADAYPYYKPPIRKWAVDANFLNLNWSKLPPGTPQVLKLVRSQWRVIAASNPN